MQTDEIFNRTDSTVLKAYTSRIVNQILEVTERYIGELVTEDYGYGDDMTIIDDFTYDDSLVSTLSLNESLMIGHQNGMINMVVPPIGSFISVDDELFKKDDEVSTKDEYVNQTATDGAAVDFVIPEDKSSSTASMSLVSLGDNEETKSTDAVAMFGHGCRERSVSQKREVNKVRSPKIKVKKDRKSKLVLLGKPRKGSRSAGQDEGTEGHKLNMSSESSTDTAASTNMSIQDSENLPENKKDLKTAWVKSLREISRKHGASLRHFRRQSSSMEDVTAPCLPRVVHEGAEDSCSVVTDLHDSEVSGGINQLPGWMELLTITKV